MRSTGGKDWGRDGQLSRLGSLICFEALWVKYLCIQLTAFDISGDWGNWIEKTGQ